MRNDNTFRQELDQALDYRKVLEEIAGCASFSVSQEKILDTLPQSDQVTIQRQLDLAKEGMELARMGSAVSMAGITDISGLLEMAVKGQVLQPLELLEIYLFLRAVSRIQKAFDQQYPLLEELAQSLMYDARLDKALSSALEMNGTLRADASPKLVGLHRELNETRASMVRAGREFVRRHSSSLMENMTTTISGRLCVLVKAADKNSFGGMIHGSSQSGQAFYVEPQTFVNLNNQVQSLQGEIEEEKIRICRELSRMVGAQNVGLASDLETMTEIDTALAKGKWGTQVDGTIPVMQSRDHSLRIIHGVHPLLNRETAVPNNYQLKPSQACLMISGPNMGGKTVTLKTIGLAIALSHAGFPVCAHEALLPWYRDLWLDIGDNQSIENNLSTFSSHMKRIADLCQHGNSGTFALLDEVGNGTDPLEGASLATAVLDDLIRKGATILTSTHYSQVKTYGKANPAVLVSSMEFDSETLRPTYRYVEDSSGASYAFSIASACGLPRSIIDNAEKRKEENASQVQKELEKLETLQEKVRKKEERFNHLIEDAHRIQKEADEEKSKWVKKKEQLEEGYQQDLEAMLEEKRQKADEILKQLKGSGKLHEQIALKHGIDSLAEPKETTVTPQEGAPLKVGDYVRLKNLNTHGEIVDIRKKEATVVANGIKTRVKLNQLEKMARPQPKPAVRRARVDSVAARFPLELNIIGMHVEEGLQALDHYMDQAVLHHACSVRIIHGMGTGKLRAAVWEDLKKRSTVKSFEAGGPSEGGLGATVVILK